MSRGWRSESAKEQQRQQSTEHSVDKKQIANIMLLVGQESKERQEMKLTIAYTCHTATPPA